jgi:hypothetical protein
VHSISGRDVWLVSNNKRRNPSSDGVRRVSHGVLLNSSTVCGPSRIDPAHKAKIASSPSVCNGASSIRGTQSREPSQPDPGGRNVLEILRTGLGIRHPGRARLPPSHGLAPHGWLGSSSAAQTDRYWQFYNTFCVSNPARATSLPSDASRLLDTSVIGPFHNWESSEHHTDDGRRSEIRETRNWDSLVDILRYHQEDM